MFMCDLLIQVRLRGLKSQMMWELQSVKMYELVRGDRAGKSGA